MSPLVLGLALAVGAPALKEKPPEPSLVGDWTPEAVTVNGVPGTPGSDRWAFRADGTRAVYGQGLLVAEGAYAWDARGSTVDLLPAGGGRPDHLCRCRLDGDTLVLTFGHTPGARPAEVEPAGKATVWVFKRLKKKD